MNATPIYDQLVVDRSTAHAEPAAAAGRWFTPTTVEPTLEQPADAAEPRA
ncbi:hypothetical protein [Nonomuraea recticatena]|uniref:Uncharacterized protein n=1 Tax=Nonomuraea recticatena TaxID=46178 RepID=A0ABP6FHE8_9ACTN